MSKGPLLSTDSTQVTDERKNPIAQSSIFQRYLEESFGGSILPPRSQRKFQKIDAPLYISQRKWINDRPFTATDNNYMHEEFLDSQFWDKETARKLVFIVGGMGSGKTTFLDFYLRCYCPTISQHRHEFEEKLVINVNAKTSALSLDLVKTFYRQAADCISSRCDSTFLDTVERLSAINRDTDPESWTNRVLGEIADRIAHDTGYVPFKYIVVAIDNLDQTPPIVQKRALDIVGRWLQMYSAGIWRVYLPMWPQTHDRLMNALGQPFPRETYEVVPLGAMPSPNVRSTRTDNVVTKIKETAVVVISAEGPDDGDVIIDGTIDNSKSRGFIVDTHTSATHFLGEFVEKLCHNDLRRELTIWENILSSNVSFSDWTKYSKEKSKIFGSLQLPYDLVDAALTGKTSHHNSDKSRIINIFNCDEKDMLVGIHALCILLSYNGSAMKNIVIRALECLGHNEVVCEATLNKMLYEANMFHEVAEGIGIRSSRDAYNLDKEDEQKDPYHSRLILHSDAISCYRDLLFHPAYLDEMAMVTPVEDRSGMFVTTLLDFNSFVSRVGTTLAFLSQLRATEVEWMESVGDQLDKLSEDRQGKWRRQMNTIPLPVVWCEVALKYRERLEGLKRTGRVNAAIGVGTKFWSDVLEGGVLSDAISAPRYWNPIFGI